MDAYRTSLHLDKWGGFLATKRDKTPLTIHPTPVIRGDPTWFLSPSSTRTKAFARHFRSARERSEPRRKPRKREPFRRRRRRHGRGRAEGQGDPLFAAGASLALLDAVLRRDPPFAGALRQRLVLMSAAASAKILRVNADAAALRDLRFAVSDALGPAAKLLSLWRDLAGRPSAFHADRLATVAARLDLALPDPNGLASSLKDCAGEGDPVSAAGKTAALVFSVFPDAPAAEAEILALWVFDLALAIRLRWARPLPLIATQVLNPALRSPGVGRRPRPGEPAWERPAAAAVALAAASALDLAADLSRRSEALLVVAPKLRAKPAAKVVDLVLAEDCVSPAEAARHAPMTGRAARRLFDRLVLLGAAREFSGRPTFRLYGL
jgi:hypothetical protein